MGGCPISTESHGVGYNIKSIPDVAGWTLGLVVATRVEGTEEGSDGCTDARVGAAASVEQSPGEAVVELVEGAATIMMSETGCGY